GVVLTVGYASVFAQTAPVSGTVELRKDDGTTEPVVGALVEVYRTDIKAGGPSAKTSKKGDFTFAGLLYVGTYSLSVSAPNCSPTTLRRIRAGTDKILITMVPGDGSKFTEEQVRQNAAAPSGSPTELTAEQKKAQAQAQ